MESQDREMRRLNLGNIELENSVSPQIGVDQPDDTNSQGRPPIKRKVTKHKKIIFNYGLENRIDNAFDRKNLKSAQPFRRTRGNVRVKLPLGP
jgi:hypothetical protein